MHIQFTDNQIRRLRDLAARQDRSLADLVRESVDRYVQTKSSADREELKRRAIAVIGRYRSTVRNLGNSHDKYFAEAIRKRA